jgi:hypothetical protein
MKKMIAMIQRRTFMVQLRTRVAPQLRGPPAGRMSARWEDFL